MGRAARPMSPGGPHRWMVTQARPRAGLDRTPPTGRLATLSLPPPPDPWAGEAGELRAEIAKLKKNNAKPLPVQPTDPSRCLLRNSHDFPLFSHVIGAVVVGGTVIEMAAEVGDKMTRTGVFRQITAEGSPRPRRRAACPSARLIPAPKLVPVLLPWAATTAPGRVSSFSRPGPAPSPSTRKDTTQSRPRVAGGEVESLRQGGASAGFTHRGDSLDGSLVFRHRAHRDVGGAENDALASPRWGRIRAGAIRTGTVWWIIRRHVAGDGTRSPRGRAPSDDVDATSPPPRRAAGTLSPAVLPESDGHRCIKPPPGATNPRPGPVADTVEGPRPTYPPNGKRNDPGTQS